MIDLKTYQKLDTAMREKQREADRLQGAFEADQRALLAEFKVQTMDELKGALSKMEAEAAELESKFEADLKAFKERYPDVLPR